MARQVFNSETQPTVRTDPALHPKAAVNEVALVAQGPSGPVAVKATAAGALEVDLVVGDIAAITVADGADVTQGAIADAAVTGDTAGTLSAKLRGLLKILTSVWDSIGGFLRVSDGGSTFSVDDGGFSLTVDAQKATTATRSQVTASTTAVTLLAANSSRLGATIYNDSNRRLILSLGAGVMATNYTVKLNSETYYEVPFDYTGVIEGLWESPSPTNGAKMTELT